MTVSEFIASCEHRRVVPDEAWAERADVGCARCSVVTPSRRRPMTVWLYIMPRACWLRSNGLRASGVQTCAGSPLICGPRFGNWNDAGMMPTIV